MADLHLSPRECQVVQLLVDGLNRKEIARELGISAHTVSCYLVRIRCKTGQRTLLAAVIYVLRHDMVMVNSV